MKFAKNVVTHTRVPHGGLYSLQNTGRQIIDFSSNVNPLGFPPSIKKIKWTLLAAVYPDPESTQLRAKLAEYLKSNPACLVVGNGATEIIYNFCRAAIRQNTPVLITSPTFGEYEAATKLCGATLKFFKTMNLQDDIAEFMLKIPSNGVVFVCNPNNPTGTLVSKNYMINLVKKAAQKKTFVFVDECFIEMSCPEESVVDVVEEFENLIVLRSLTKSFGLAGLRVGYGVGNKKLAAVLNKINMPWNVNGVAQKAAVVALRDQNFISRSRKLVNAERKFLKSKIAKIGGFYCHNSEANFILIKTKHNSTILQKKLLEKNILVRDCSTFRGLGTNYIRVAVKTHKENQQLIKAMEEIK